MERYLDFQKLKAKKLIQLVKNNQVCRSMQMPPILENPAKKFAGYVMSALEIMKKRSYFATHNIISAAREMTKEEILNRLDANEDEF